VAYDDRQNYLLEADVGVSLHFDHLETMYSFRTRMLDYLWAGLPIVATDGDGFAQVVAAERIGTVVPGDDVDAVVEALVGLLGDSEERARCRARIAVVATRFRWSVALEPLVSFCAAPRPAPDAPVWPARSRPALPPQLPDAGDGAGALRRVARLYRQGGVAGVAAGAGRRVRLLLARR
jgi:hypothetical protein